MGADDDADCVEHVWELAELDVTERGGMALAHRCVRCGATYYEPSAREEKNRPRL